MKLQFSAKVILPFLELYILYIINIYISIGHPSNFSLLNYL